ncbi:group I intron-associated PD-(D/E)XK endonuclease [Helicobacter pylori]|uniref:group I intron-associated PD-(D/E)XK endonuclease n=1 Tax=Helicobacter pylori TaxID=210 RepID=UPI003307AF70
MDNHAHQAWVINLTGIDKGIFRTMNGNADELIAIGRVIKAGFPCSRVDVTNAKYDAIVDLGGKQKLLRIQIKGTGGDTLNFTGGYRSGVQIDRNAPKRTYKYTKKDCDLILGIDTHTSECYIIPIEDTQEWGNTKSLSQLQHYKENWQILIDLALE